VQDQSSAKCLGESWKSILCCISTRPIPRTVCWSLLEPFGEGGLEYIYLVSSIWWKGRLNHEKKGNLMALHLKPHQQRQYERGVISLYRAKVISGRNRKKRNKKYRAPKLKEITEFYQEPDITILPMENFYRSDEWRALRRYAISIYGNRCLCCSIVPTKQNLHIDHIYPRSSFPERRLKLTNTQPLCNVCNMKKFTDIIDYRTPDQVRAAEIFSGLG